MNAIKQYLLSIVICSIIGCVSTSFFKHNCTAGRMIKLISCVFMIITIISPIKNIDFPDLSVYYDDVYSDASNIINNVNKQLNAQTVQYIKQNTEAYILDKAIALDTELSVEVILDDNTPPVPVKVYIRGNISPYKKAALSEYIQTNLNIAKENQLWE